MEMINDYEIIFANLSQILPSQHRFASANVRDKITKALASKILQQNQYDQDKSLYSANDASPAVATKDGYILTDGHHSALASLQLNYQTMPLKIIDTWQGAIDEEFWRWAEQKQYAYLKKIDGTISYQLPTLTQLKDDPLRYFASLSARKFYGSLKMEDSTGTEFPLWIKIRKDIPYIEWQLTDHLRAYGFSYSYGEEQERLQFLIEQARIILRKHSLPGLKFIPQQQRYDQSTHILEWLQSCPPL